MNNDNKFLGEEKISKLLLKFSIPCILSLVISSLYNLVDQIFVGHIKGLNGLGLTATGVVYPLTIVAMAIAWCLGDGATAYLSLCQGRGDTKNAHKAVGNNITLTIILSIVFVIVGFLCMDNLLYTFGATKNCLELAKDYFKIILIGIPFFMFANCLNGIIRADGAPKFSMAATMVGAIMNLILDPIFIFTLGYGIKGAAIATILGQIASAVISLVYLFQTKTFHLEKDSFLFNKDILINIIKLGISSFITQMAIVLVSLVCNITLNRYGKLSKYGADIPIGAITICMKVFGIIINIIVGIILGAQPILGYNYGAKKYDRVKETFKLSAICSLIVGIIFTIMIEVFPGSIVGVFGVNKGLYLEFSILTLRIFLMFVILSTQIKLISIFFQSVGEPVRATIASLSRDIVIFIPLVLILGSVMGVTGPLWAGPVADLIGFIISSIMVIQFMHKLPISMKESHDDKVIQDSKKGVIVTISREHGTAGKYIGELVANKLHIPYYYKELTALAAKESGLSQEFLSKFHDEETGMNEVYLTSTPAKYATIAQEKVIREIANHGSCVIVGRAADYILRNYPDVVRVFIYADDDYKINKIKEMYHDNDKIALRNMKKSNKNRATYYSMISGTSWGDYKNYDLMINASIGTEETANIIIDYIKRREKK